MHASLPLSLALALALAVGADGAGAGAGVTLKTYTNMGLFGVPASATILDSAAFALPADKPFSAELSGSLSFPPAGAVYHFACNFTEGTMAFVWVDGHMICQDAHRKSAIARHLLP